MSGPLVPAPTKFQQQGSVDWVELSGRSVQFSVAVLARLSKAGIDPFTLQVGRAICTNFSLNPIAQGRISDAILALKKFGSYGDIMWFGFGVKHVVTDLAETEEGLTLVAICAALSTTYDSLYGAHVLRELCGLCKAPQSFSPAIRQWKVLVELCAGILSSSQFALILDGFRRLVSQRHNAPELEPNRCPTTYSALAEAILNIAQVTTRRLASATFTGGLDCIWLAAVAEWVFSLDIVIYNSEDVLLYRSRCPDQQPPQITLVYLNSTHEMENQSFVSERTSLIRSGLTLFVHENENSLGDLHFFNWRSSWSTILHDTFHEGVDRLLTGENGYHFGLYLYCVSMIKEPDLRYKTDKDASTDMAHLFSENVVDPLLWINENSRGHKFLSFASRRLPELNPCLQHDFSSIPSDQVVSRALAARRSIESKCTKHPVGMSDLPQHSICLIKLAELIVLFLWITLMSDIDEEISPSVLGLGNVYRWISARRNEKDHVMNIDCGQSQTALVFYILSGLTVDYSSTTVSSSYLAMAGAGICIYRQALVDPNLAPDSISRFKVVPGYISHAGAIFKSIRNLSGWRNPPNFTFDASSTCHSVKALVQEMDRDSELAMAYQVDYVDAQGKSKFVFMSLGRLIRDLQSRTTMVECEGGCSDLPIRSQQNVNAPDMNKGISDWRDTRRYPIVLFDHAATDNAQSLIADLKRSSNLWVRASMIDISRPGPGDSGRFKNFQAQILADRPFLIYLSLKQKSRYTLCIFRFTPCLSCIVERGCLARIYGQLRESMPLSGALHLMAPGSIEQELVWQTLKPNFRQRFKVPR